jgi:1-acyl-sn-glycerol-3-phosphate acyltransferase
MSATQESGAGAVAGIAEFLEGLRLGLEAGLDPASAMARAAPALPEHLRDLSERLGEALEVLARRWRGEYREDEWGFDEDFAEAAYPFFELLYEHWFRVEAVGARNVPAHGRALVVANHAGSIFPFDAAMMTVALMKEHPLPRWPRFMLLDWAFELPFVSIAMRRVGAVPADPRNAEALLSRDELVMAFPEGSKGPRKSFAERYRLQRFGRGGFVEVALRTGSPIVPVAVVGAEEIYPKLGELRPLARAVGAPFIPVTPTFPWLGPLGLLPLPARWRIEFCRPLDLSGYTPADADDRALVLDVTERVRDRIQEKIYENLIARGSPFL